MKRGEIPLFSQESLYLFLAHPFYRWDNFDNR